MASAGPSPPVLIEKRNARSAIWHFFGYEPDEHGQPKNPSQPRCKRCHGIVPTKGANTTNLAAHLHDKHPDLFKEFKEVGSLNESLKSAHELGERVDSMAKTSKLGTSSSSSLFPAE